MATKTPFKTTNRSLAVALYTAGVEFITLRNVYTGQQLKNWGFKTGIDALRVGRLGTIHYFAEPVDNIEQLIAAYDQQQNVPDSDDSETQSDIPQEDIMRIVCQSQKSRNALEKQAKDPRRAYELHVHSEITFEETQELDRQLTQAKEQGTEMSFTLPGFTLVHAMASEATRKGLGL